MSVKMMSCTTGSLFEVLMLVGSDYTVFSDEKNSSFFSIFQQDPCTVLVTCDPNMVQIFLRPAKITAFLYLSNLFKERAFQVQHFRLKLLAESTSKCVQKKALIFTENTGNNMDIETPYTSSDIYVKNVSKHFSKYLQCCPVHTCTSIMQ